MHPPQIGASWSVVGGGGGVPEIVSQLAQQRGCPPPPTGGAFPGLPGLGFFLKSLVPAAPRLSPRELWVADSGPAGLHQLLAKTQGAAPACLGDTWL